MLHTVISKYTEKVKQIYIYTQSNIKLFVRDTEIIDLFTVFERIYNEFP